MCEGEGVFLLESLPGRLNLIVPILDQKPSHSVAVGQGSNSPVAGELFISPKTSQTIRM